MLLLLQNHTKAPGKVKLSFVSPIKAFADDLVARIFNPAVVGRALILCSELARWLIRIYLMRKKMNKRPINT
jgi:hypothetical protein